MKLEKYTAGGNDFLIFYSDKSDFDMSKMAQNLCNRHFGIGSDGLIRLFRSNKANYEWEFFNSDGSSALMCGNASLCVASYALAHNLAPKKHIFYNGQREITVEILENFKDKNIVKSNLGKPSEIKKVSLPNKIFGNYGFLINTGVPHLCIFVDSIHSMPDKKSEEIAFLRAHFDANVNFIYLQEGERKMRVHTFERGVEDFTLSCGTGMAASAAVAYVELGLSGEIEVITRSDSKYILNQIDNELVLIGVAKYIASLEVMNIACSKVNDNTF